jgi:lipid A 4'-phosphatase
MPMFLTNNLSKLFFAIFFATIIYYFAPQIDLWVSGIFYSEQDKFYLKEQPALKIIYLTVPYIMWRLAIIYIVLLVIITIAKKPLFGISDKKIVYLALALLIGPGIIVNVICKDNLFGRARPNQIKEFGGDKIFTRPLVITDQCKSNCSFASGHAAAAFYLTSFALITIRWSKLIWALSLFFGIIVGLVRIMQGGHFFSDVVFSGLIVILVNYFLYYLIFLRNSKLS